MKPEKSVQDGNRANGSDEFKVIVSMLIFGTIGLFRKGIALGSGMLVLLRALLGLGFILICQFIRKKHPDWKQIREKAPALILSGIFLGLNWVLLFEAYRFTTVAIATMCYYTAPIFVMLLCPILLPHTRSFTRSDLLCMSLALAGMLLISGILGEHGGQTDPRGLLLGLAAALLYALIVLINVRTASVPAMDKTAVQLGSAAILMIPYVLLRWKNEALPLDGQQFILVLIVGIVHTGIAYALYFDGMGRLPALKTALLAYIDPVTAVLISALVLKEPFRFMEGLGCVLILISAIMGDLIPQKKTDHRS